MVQLSKDALAQVVRGLREARSMTQERLGREAGYGEGAGVSISRLESGLLHPSPERFAGIAEALGITAAELEARAFKQAAETDLDHSSSIGASDGAQHGSKELKTRAAKIQHEVDEMRRAITGSSEEFNKQHDRARDEFFMRFVEIAERVEGAPQLDPAQLQDDDVADADAVAAYRLEANASGIGQLLAGGAGGAAAGAAVGSAAAYGTFVAVASFGTASTGAAISGLSGVAATNAALAWLGGGTLAAGGAGVVGGTMALATIVAAPAVILFAGGLWLMTKRNRKQQQELATQLNEAEAELAATRPGFEALLNILPRAAKTLGYIATHAGHSLNRWEDQLGPGSMTWDSLGESGQRHYRNFVEVAAAQLAIATINFQGLLTTRGSDQDDLIQLADEVLTKYTGAVMAHV